MPYYRVTVRQDAWIYHTGYVEADSKAAAAEAAEHAWKFGEQLAIPFAQVGVEGFDDGECDADDDVEEIDEAEFKAELDDVTTEGKPMTLEQFAAHTTETRQLMTIIDRMAMPPAVARDYLQALQEYISARIEALDIEIDNGPGE